MEIRKLSYDCVSDIAKFANNKKIADNLRNVFPTLTQKKMLGNLSNFALILLKVSKSIEPFSTTIKPLALLASRLAKMFTPNVLKSAIGWLNHIGEKGL